MSHARRALSKRAAHALLQQLDPGPHMPKTFRIASFNVENLLHPELKFARDPNETTYSAEQFEDKVNWIVGILRDGRAELVGFQELFSERAFKLVTAMVATKCSITSWSVKSSSTSP